MHLISWLRIGSRLHGHDDLNKDDRDGAAVHRCRIPRRWSALQVPQVCDRFPAIPSCSPDFLWSLAGLDPCYPSISPDSGTPKSSQLSNSAWARK